MSIITIQDIVRNPVPHYMRTSLIVSLSIANAHFFDAQLSIAPHRFALVHSDLLEIYHSAQSQCEGDTLALSAQPTGPLHICLILFHL